MVRLWECETITHLGWREDAWVRLSLDERARKVCSYKLPDWLKGLEAERESRRLKAKYGN